MKTFIWYGTISKEELGDEVFQEVCRLYPKGQGDGWFKARLNIEDPVATKIKDVLERNGFRPWPNFRPCASDEYQVNLHREYDQSDIDNAVLLRPRAPQVKGLHRYWPKPARLYDGRLRRNQKIVSNYVRIAVLAVRDDVKIAMAKAKLKGVKFSLLKIEKKASADERYWELTSDRILPALAPYSILLNNYGLPFDGDYDNGCFLRDGLYADPELHFLEAAIDAEPPFDLARTHERFGIKDQVAYPALVASKRFYQFCIEEGLSEMNWVPVRLDPG